MPRPSLPPVAQSSVSLISSMVMSSLHFTLTATVDGLGRLDDATAPGVGFLVVLGGHLSEEGLYHGQLTRAIVIENIVITEVTMEGEGRGIKRKGGCYYCVAEVNVPVNISLVDFNS